MEKRNLLLLSALFFASLNLRPSITSVSPVLETIRAELEMSGAAASLLTSIPVLCMGIFPPLAAKLAFRWWEERVIALSLALVGAGTLLRAIPSSQVLFIFTAFLTGVGIAAAGPLLNGFVKRYFPERVAAMIGVYTVAMVIGAGLSTGFTVPLQEAFHGSWRGSLALWSLFAVLALPFWGAIVKGTAKRQGEPKGVGGNLPWRNRRAWYVTLFFGMMAMMFYSVTAWLAPAVETLGYGKVYASAAVTVFLFTQIPATIAISWLTGKFSSRFPWLAASVLFELAGLFFLIEANVQPWLPALFLGIGAGGLFPLALMLTIDTTTRPEEANAWSAMVQSVGYIIGSTGPFIVGWIRDATGNFLASFFFLIAVGCAMILLGALIAGTRMRVQRKGEEVASG